jgi:dehydrogenase/reductase SDR family protein 12
VLINNAGVLENDRSVTDEGFERTYATNLLCPYVLTEMLLPKLEASAPARVITVSSGGMYTARLDPNDLETERQRYDGPSAYARTKRGQVILTELWAERMRGRGVAVFSMHPGWAETPGVSRSLPRFDRVMGPLLRTPAQGADTIVWLASDPDVPSKTGLFFHDRVPRPTHRAARTQESDADRGIFVEVLERHARMDTNTRS